MKQPSKRPPVGASRKRARSANANLLPSADIARFPNVALRRRTIGDRAQRSRIGVWRASTRSSAAADRAAVLRTIERVVIPSEPEWSKAREGDAAAAVGLAIRLVLIDHAPPLRQELALTALWVSAAEGDATARMVLAFFQARPELVGQ